jgi:ADP-ribose pyrophosphatase
MVCGPIRRSEALVEIPSRSHMPAQPTDQTLAHTPYLRLIDRDGWSFVQRTTGSGVVAVIAVTADQQLILVEQHRPPVSANVIELPAGLAGDLHDRPLENLAEAARRELLEETGYRAGRWQELVTVASSAGLTDECIVLFLAEDLQKAGPGGGDASENIRVHEVPIISIDAWLSEASARGALIDGRVYAALYLLQNRSQRAADG